MAPVNFNQAAFDKVSSALTYAKIYKYIMKDFMGKLDCKAVHTNGNIFFSGANTGGPVLGPCYATIVQGGSDSIARSLQAKYIAAAKTGDIVDKITDGS